GGGRRRQPDRPQRARRGRWTGRGGGEFGWSLRGPWSLRDAIQRRVQCQGGPPWWNGIGNPREGLRRGGAEMRRKTRRTHCGDGWATGSWRSRESQRLKGARRQRRTVAFGQARRGFRRDKRRVPCHVWARYGMGWETRGKNAPTNGGMAA